MVRPVVLVVTRRPEAWLSAEEALAARFEIIYFSPTASPRPAPTRAGFLIFDKDAGPIGASAMDELLSTYEPAATVVIGHQTIPANLFDLLLPGATDPVIGAPQAEVPAPATPPSLLSRIWGDARAAMRGTSSATQLNGCLLGPFQVAFANTLIDHWPQQKARSLFAYLLHNHQKGTRRDTLMQLFWPYVDTDSARNSLNVALHAIRRAFKPLGLPASIIQHHQGRYQLNPDLTLSLDTEMFVQLSDEGMRQEQRGNSTEAVEAYAHALTHYRGPFMEEEPGEWPERDRMMLAEREVLLLDRISRHQAREGQHVATIASCEQIIQKDPYREDAHRRLMRALYLDGQREKALRQYIICEEMLRRQFQIEAARETKNLVAAIKNDDFQAILRDSPSF